MNTIEYLVSEDAMQILKGRLNQRLIERKIANCELDVRVLDGIPRIVLYEETDPDSCCYSPITLVTEIPLSAHERAISDLGMNKFFNNKLYGGPLHRDGARATGENESVINILPDDY